MPVCEESIARALTTNKLAHTAGCSPKDFPQLNGQLHQACKAILCIREKTRLCFSLSCDAAVQARCSPLLFDGELNKGLCKNNLPIGRRQSLGIERSKVAQYCTIWAHFRSFNSESFRVAQSVGYFCTVPYFLRSL